MSQRAQLREDLACIEAMVAALAALQRTFDDITRRQCTTTLRIIQEASAVSALGGGEDERGREHLRREVEHLSGGMQGLRTANQQLAVLQSKLVGQPDGKHSPSEFIDELYRAVIHVVATGIIATAQTDVALRELDIGAVLSAAENCLSAMEVP